jgi:Zn-dependent peptidase ImmA (M78 family)
MAKEDPPLGQFEVNDINTHVDRLLRDMGRPEPPLSLEDVRRLQKLDLTYYSKADISLLDEMAHRAKMAGSTIMSSAKRMIDIVDQFGLRGLLMLKENEKKIYIDDKVAELKRRFIIAHEITHDLLPWHRALLLGDNESTLSPSCHQIMEAEANYGGRRLIFMGDKFRTEARDYPLSWDTIEKIKKRFGNTLTTTLWQMVQEWDPMLPVFGMVHKHPHRVSLGDSGNKDNVRYFIRSDAFKKRFGNVSDKDTFDAVRSYASMKTRGPVGAATCVLLNANGEPCDFEMFTFSNGYDLLTLGQYLSLHRRVVGF